MAINMECYVNTTKAEYKKLVVPTLVTTIVGLITIALIVWFKEISAAVAPYMSAINLWMLLLVITAAIYYVLILSSTNKEAEATKSTDSVAAYGIVIGVWFMLAGFLCEKIITPIIVQIVITSVVSMAIITVTTPLAIAYARCKEEKNGINV